MPGSTTDRRLSDRLSKVSEFRVLTDITEEGKKQCEDFAHAYDSMIDAVEQSGDDLFDKLWRSTVSGTRQRGKEDDNQVIALSGKAMKRPHRNPETV